jgi:hypothetical protein
MSCKNEIEYRLKYSSKIVHQYNWHGNLIFDYFIYIIINSYIPMDFTMLCEEVFALHNDIRYAGVIDDTGLLIAGGMRKGLASMTEKDNDDLYLTQTAIRKSMREKFDKTMGKARFAYIKRERIAMLTFYTAKNILIVSIEPNVDSHTIVDIATDTLELLDGKT